MLVLIIAQPKCTLASSHAAPGTVRQTSERYITLSATSIMIEHIKYTDAIAELDGPLYIIRLKALGYLCTSCDCHVRRMMMIGDSRCTVDNLFIATWLRLGR